MNQFKQKEEFNVFAKIKLLSTLPETIGLKDVKKGDRLGFEVIKINGDEYELNFIKLYETNSSGRV